MMVQINVKYLLYIITIMFLLTTGCRADDGNYVWVYMEKGLAIEVSSVSPPKADNKDIVGKWEKIEIGPWNVHTEINYSMVSERRKYKLHIDVLWSVSEPLTFAEHKRDPSNIQKELLKHLISAAGYIAMKDYEKEVMNDGSNHSNIELTSFLENRITNILLVKKLGSSDTTILDFVGIQIDEIRVEIE